MHLGQTSTNAAEPPWRDITFTVRDGLRLYARHYPARRALGLRPALCLPGITQNSQDSHDLAVHLATTEPAPRDVYTIDYRGRGRSEYDEDWRNYSPYFEMLDVLDFLALARLHDTAVVGTSRGGMIAMILGAVRPAAIGAVVLNDIGPEIETAGWIRQMGRIGRIPVPKSWREAARYVRELEKDDYPRLTDEQWVRLARQRYFDRDGAPAATYDPSISRAFSLGQIAAGVPPMWAQFRSLCRVPLLAVRGELSNVLSEATLQKMESVHPQMYALTVPGQGHAPLLTDAPSMDAVRQFLALTDQTAHRTGAGVSRAAGRLEGDGLALDGGAAFAQAASTVAATGGHGSADPFRRVAAGRRS